ncbi:MAG: efflux RND transporter periplasmic adaptor subunit [Gloeobacteraceae cyanobacterium ES-bin-144]|nr:efflux RND transporter periplasmic adaptor subunit [Verrucomicrobiales bacterium]
MKLDASGKELAETITAARPGHPVRKWLIAAAVIGLLVLGFWVYHERSAKSTSPIYTSEILERGNLDLSITATGNLAPTNEVTIGSELSGIIQDVYVDANDYVIKGQKLARLDANKITLLTERSRATLASAKARVGQADATVREAKASLARLEELHRISEGKTPSKSQLESATATADRAEADLKSAMASVAESEATVRTNENDLGKTVITSPVDGVVLTRSVEVGQTVAASFTAPILFLIAEDLKKMELVVTVAEADIGRVAAGQNASFTVDAWPTRTYSATVKRVAFGSVITNNVVTYKTELAVTNDDLSLRPGMTATAEIEVAKKESILLVPNSALRFDPSLIDALGKKPETQRTLVQSLSPGGGRRWSQNMPAIKLPTRGKGTSVWTLKDGQPSEIPVTIGITDGRFTEATGEGLTEGMPIILSVRLPSDP